MTAHNRIGGTLAAAALALSGGAASASARPFDFVGGSMVPAGVAAATANSSPHSPVPCGDVCSGGYGAASLPASTPNDSGARLRHDGRPRPLALRSGYTAAGAPPAVIRVVTHDGGFNWADAGIGAGGALVLSLLGVGGFMAISRRRPHGGTEAALTT